jgi:hypothetical protein
VTRHGGTLAAERARGEEVSEKGTLSPEEQIISLFHHNYNLPITNQPLPL